MTHTPECDHEEPYTAPFLELCISLIVFMTLQILWLGRTVYFEYKKRNEEKKDGNVWIVLTYILLQLCGIYFTLIDLLRYVINPYTKSVENNDFACLIVAYSPKVITIIYFAMYLSHVLLRLEASFRDTFLAISKSSFLFLTIFIVLEGIIIPPLFFIFAQPACIWKWEPMDIATSGDWAICDIYSGDAGDAANNVIFLNILVIIIANIIYETIFCLKLMKLLQRQLDETNTWKLKSLIIKNSILTATAASTTLFFWFLWLSVGASLRMGISFLYFDYWINCFLVGCMFEYNEKYYTKICHSCIICCFMKCDKSFDKNDGEQREKQLKRTKKYLLGIYEKEKPPKSPKAKKVEKELDEYVDREKSEKSINYSRKTPNHSSTEIIFDDTMMQMPKNETKMNTMVHTMSLSSHIPAKSIETTTMQRSDAMYNIQHLKDTMDVPRFSNTATGTAMSSTCKTASGIPQFVNRLTPFHEEQESL